MLDTILNILSIAVAIVLIIFIIHAIYTHYIMRKELRMSMKKMSLENDALMKKLTENLNKRVSKN